VDAKPSNGNIDVKKLAQAAEDLSKGGKSAEKWLPRGGVPKDSKLKAILAVDVFGQPADYNEIQKIADDYNLKVIEDSCEAIGAQYRGQAAGRLGDAGVFAFYPNKQMTTGEGGVIVTDNEESADFMRALRNQGRSLGDTWLQHSHLGYNYRLTELSAVLGRIQLTRLDSFLENRAQVAEWYWERLEEVDQLTLPQIDESTTRMSWFLFVVQVSSEIDRDGIIRKLEEEGIPSRPYFSPIHLQPFMRERFDYREGDFPVSEDLGKRGLALPFSGIMDEAQVDLVCEELIRALK
jgi:dTDP-4-amino-4,6-dideoxygalactose transaminase